MAKFPARLPRSREPSQPALSYEHIENFTKDLEVSKKTKKKVGRAAHFFVHFFAVVLQDYNMKLPETS